MLASPRGGSVVCAWFYASPHAIRPRRTFSTRYCPSPDRRCISPRRDYQLDLRLAVGPRLCTQCQPIAPARQGGEMRHDDLNSQQLSNRTHQALGLAQRLLENHAQCQAQFDCQIRVVRLPARRCSARRRPQAQRCITNPPSRDIASQCPAGQRTVRSPRRLKLSLSPLGTLLCNALPGEAQPNWSPGAFVWES